MSAHYRPLVSVMSGLARGQELVDAGDLPGGLARLDRALAGDPRCVRARLYRAALKTLLKDVPGALLDFRALAAMEHEHLTAYADLTTPQVEEFPNVVDATDAVLRGDPGCAWAYVYRSFLLKRLRRYEEAVSDMDRAVELSPRSAAVWAMRARIKLSGGSARYQGARDLSRAVALEPRWGWLHSWLGESLRRQGELPPALKALDRGLALDPGYKRGLAWRGAVFLDMGRCKEALEDLGRSLSWSPLYRYDPAFMIDQKSWSYDKRMRVRRVLGDWAGALVDLNRAHALAPHHAWVSNPKGEARLFEDAVLELDAALRRRPRLSWGWAWRGHTFMQRGRLGQALEDFERALRLAPSSAWVWAWKGHVLSSWGETAGALAALGRALALDAGYLPAWSWRAQARLKAGDVDGAARDFTRAIGLDFRGAQAYAGRGECRRRRGDAAGALADFDRALALRMDDPEAYAGRAEAKRLAGDLAGALRDAQTARRLAAGSAPPARASA